MSLQTTYNNRREAAWATMGYYEGTMAKALSLLRRGRVREARKTLEEALDVQAWFDNLPFNPEDAKARIEQAAQELNHPTTTATGGLPAGDKEVT